ncbi:MAG: membrane protein insertion efficiency factor YidD [Clostridia bacterium]|nr:membrane protein insertion efficiency factor YidD [Clostridia bacterium]
MKKLLIKAVRFYQKRISPAKGSPCCRFYPTCSAYAIEALEIHGAFKGSLLSAWRILRCNPFCKGGVDPVPEKQVKPCVRRKK